MDYISQYLASLYSGGQNGASTPPIGNPMGDQSSYQNPLAQQAMERAKEPNRYEQALQMYPKLSSVPISYKESLTDNKDVPFLEFWPKGESGSPNRPRPKEIDPNKLGVEVYKPTTRPEDVAGDIVSHHMVNTDPTLKKIYSDFEKSLDDGQKKDLKRQYVDEVIRMNREDPKEKTPTYKEWYDRSGLPSLFRGYTFKQWSPQEIKEAYRPDQLQMLDKVNEYLKSK
jgi:hypothetical protein